MQFFVKHLYLIAPILAIVAVVGGYFFLNSKIQPVPHVEIKHEEIVFDAEEYLRSLKAKNRPFSKDGVHRLLLQRTRQKEGVYLESLLPVMDSAGIEVVHCFHKVMGDDYIPVITSGNDYPYHAKNSKHYMNAALDFRIVNLPMNKRREVVEMAQLRLGYRFRVLWEKGEAEHLHVEVLEVPE